MRGRYIGQLCTGATELGDVWGRACRLGGYRRVDTASSAGLRGGTRSEKTTGKVEMGQ